MIVNSIQGHKKAVIAQLEGSLLSPFPSARSSPHCTEAQLHIEQTGTRAAQRKLRAVISPPAPLVPPGSGPHHLVVVVGLSLF